MWPTGEGNGKPLQYSCLENPMNSMKRQNDRKLKEELPRSVGAQYATGDQWRNNFRKNEGKEPKQKQYPAVDVTGDRSKVRCCEEQNCIGWIQADSKHARSPRANAGRRRDTSSIPGLGRSPGEGKGNVLQYSCLGNPTDRGDWWATVHEVSKSWT